MSALLAFDPGAPDRRWVAEFTWTLDIVPGLLEVLVDATLPTIPVGLGSRFDKDQINGGGYRDNMQLLDRFVTGTEGRMHPVGAAADAVELWDWVRSYTAAVEAWITPQRPTPPLPSKVNPDPLTARGEALLIVGWLIDHADQVVHLHELEDHRAEMFSLIRRLRGRYGVFNHPRRLPLEVCVVTDAKGNIVGGCGETTVRTWWTTSRDGRARSIEVKSCLTCGDEHREDEGTEA